ncbi:hypothetical protein B0H11DRAFT_2261202 [Mycena galericulata]|nr:hypothetical protein B0H11DRAFT_2261202 [Mycena galericulata]
MTTSTILPPFSFIFTSKHVVFSQQPERNFEGQFDSTGANFADSADFYQLSDTTLVARLANLDGDYADASIDLDSVVTNNNGRLEKAQ